ncbi:hypothetical protein D3C81_2228970 [compost metagenome]
MRLEDRRDLLPGEPSIVVEDMNAGLGIPLLMQDDICCLGCQILTMQYVPFQRMNTRPVTRYQKCVQREGP